MSLEDDVSIRKAEVEAALRRERNTKILMDGAKETIARPEWSVELAEGIRNRGIPTMGMLGLKLTTDRFDNNLVRIYTKPDVEINGWIIQSHNDRQQVTMPGNAPMVLSDEGVVWKNYTRNFRSFLQPEDEARYASKIDAVGKRYLKSQGLKTVHAVGVDPSQFYSDYDIIEESEKSGWYLREYNRLAIATLVTIDNFPANVYKGLIDIHKDAIPPYTG